MEERTLKYKKCSIRFIMTYGLLKTSCYKLNAKRFLFFYSHKTKLLKSKSVLPLQVYFHRFNLNANDVEIYLRKIAVLLQKLDSFWNIRWVTFTMDKIFCKRCIFIQISKSAFRKRKLLGKYWLPITMKCHFEIHNIYISALQYEIQIVSAFY